MHISLQIPYTGSMATSLAAPLTLEKFSKLPRGQEKHEVNAGELITMPPPKSFHSLVALAVLEALQGYLKQNPFGRAMPEAGYILSRSPLTIRQPDVSVLSKARIHSSDDYFEGAPELAVEVVSPSDIAEDLQIEVDQYLQAGAKRIWIVYPKTKRIHIFHESGSMTALDESQTLDGGDLLPGFSVKAADLLLSENREKA